MKRFEIVEAAKGLKGTPYMFQGRIQEFGLDCVGLLIEIGKVVGVKLVDCEAYSRKDVETMVRYMDLNFDKSEGVGLGSILTFRIRWGAHIGVCVGDTMVHTGNVMIEEIPLLSWWRKRILGIYEFRGLV